MVATGRVHAWPLVVRCRVAALRRFRGDQGHLEGTASVMNQDINIHAAYLNRRCFIDDGSIYKEASQETSNPEAFKHRKPLPS